MRIAILLTLAACWLPGGLIHRGQLQANPNAEAVSALVFAGSACSPIRWGGCR